MQIRKAEEAGGNPDIASRALQVTTAALDQPLKSIQYVMSLLGKNRSHARCRKPKGVSPLQSSMHSEEKMGLEVSCITDSCHIRLVALILQDILSVTRLGGCAE